LTATDRPGAPKGRAPHRRDENARLAVLHAADDLLVERGFGGVTIEGIAALRGPILYRALTGARIPRTFIDGLIADALERHLAESAAAGARDG
jgi:DNA-binding transcriptional regulator YbjK